MEKLETRVFNLIRAGFSGIWIQTLDPLLTVRRLAKSAEMLKEKAQTCQLSVWSLPLGWQPPILSYEAPPVAQLPRPALFPQHLIGYRPLIAVLINPHALLEHQIEILHNVIQCVHEGCQHEIYYIFLVPTGVRPPKELEHLLVCLNEDLPEPADYLNVVRSVCDSVNLQVDESLLNDCALLLKGMTLREAENITSLAIIKSWPRLELSTIKEFKAEIIKQSGYMELITPTGGFETLGGLDHLKMFAKRTLCKKRSNSKLRPKGIFLTGIPGCGKSAFVRALGAESDRPVIQLNVGNLYGSLVGQTEQNVRRALQLADSNEPCILFIDEVEKALSGLQSSGKTDSGVSSRVFGTILTWLNDHQTDVYCVVTCNDIFKLPPEFYRSERFDAIFFVDTPSVEEQQEIWQIYIKMYGLTEQEVDMNKLAAMGFNNLTGAEIHTCCRLAALMETSIYDTLQYIVPIANIVACEEIRKQCKSFIPASSRKRENNVPYIQPNVSRKFNV